ncbi:glycosyltransferase [Aeoliella sp. ICT_H6.2]|uniref:Glycosyltransferase n=1 Tax=Aeoliella straminimaris TaxID=2954799 RepID=A0A9X2FHB6_9BACT|nr:glycosyltransferase [Aeoliella straminimaris]MCO6046714.1 glycosyltransferase [Aeoliella straminimaris]
MHFIVTAIGSYGDVHPMVGVGKRLAERGHRVTIVTNPYFAPVVEAAGLDLASVLSTDDYLRLIEYPHIWHPTKSVPYLFREAVVNLMRPLYALLEELYTPGETVVAAHTLDAASRVFRERTGARVATVTFAPQAIWSRHEPPKLGAVPVGPDWPRWWNDIFFWFGNRLVIDPSLAKPLNSWRRELDLPPVRRLFPDWWFAADTNVCLFPEWFGPVQPDWPRPVEAVGFPLWDAGDTTALPGDVQAFVAEGQPPLVFTPGTANTQAADFFRVAVEVCQRLDRRGLLLTKFAGQVPNDLPPGVKHVEFVPLSRLLPSCAAFVHHGGIGSCSQGLAAGVPQLVRPMAFDQYDNVARLRRLGVAEQVVGQRFTAPRVAQAIERLIDSPAVAESCREHARRCQTNGLDRACDLLEGVGQMRLNAMSLAPEG